MTSNYDETLDKCLRDAGVIYEDRFTRLSLKVFKYGDKGRPKIQLNRESVAKNGDWVYAKVKRYTFAEWEAVNYAVQDAMRDLASGRAPEREESAASEPPEWAREA